MHDPIPIHATGAATTPPAPDPEDEASPARRPAALDGLSTFRIETWGCQMNEHDSEKMAGVLRALGLRPAGTEREADIILLNTCSVREKAAHKVFTRLGQLRQHKLTRPHTVLGVCGCVAQEEQEKIFRRAPHVDIVMGPRRIASLGRLIEESRLHRRAMAISDPADSLVPEINEVLRVSRTRAYITIMEGCNKNCTFCIVPFTRGREVCRAPQAILDEARRCVEAGLVEIELLGQNVNAWRHGAGGSAGAWDFTRLLTAVAEIPLIRRVRFTTSHPLHFKNSIIETMAAHETICRHIHLPVQSGSDRILARMRRGYTRQEYSERVERLRERIPEVALSTDVIVGFPGETSEDFDLTLDLVRRLRFDTIFSFLYSARSHTSAAEWADDVPGAEKKARLSTLQRMQGEIQMEKHRGLEGSIVEVLVDGPSSRSHGQLCGRTSQNHVVNLPGDPSMVGRFVPVGITRAGLHSLTGLPESHLTS